MKAAIRTILNNVIVSEQGYTYDQQIVWSKFVLGMNDTPSDATKPNQDIDQESDAQSD